MRVLLICIMVVLSVPLYSQHAILHGGQTAQQKKRRNKTPELTENGKSIIQNLIDNMVYVEGGSFTMSKQWDFPKRLVTLSSFYIGKFEVTQEEWKAVMGTSPSKFKGLKRPVENISWYDCQKFIRRLNSLTKKEFRLPTQAEWEYAAKGGKYSKGYKHAGSNNIDDVAWHFYNTDRSHGTHIVGQKMPNELGIYDMSGNVAEWCNDYFGNQYEDYYNDNDSIKEHVYNPQGPSKPCNEYYLKIVRGGCWSSSASNNENESEYHFPAFDSTDWLGIRLVY